jgi:hypothetical protein
MMGGAGSNRAGKEMAMKAGKVKVRLKLVGTDGNAFAILGAFQHAAREQGWSREEIKAVVDEATSGDYCHLLQTITANTR